MQAAATFTSLFGVVLIAKPVFLFGKHAGSGGPDAPTPHQRALAVTAALLSALGSAGAYTIIRYIGKRCKPLHSMSYFSAMCVVVTTLYPFFIDSPPVYRANLNFWLLMLPIGIFGFVAQITLTMGLQRENAGRGTLAVYSNIIFSLLLERVVFGTYPDLWSLLGSAIIIGSALRVALAKKEAAPLTPVVPDPETGAGDEDALLGVAEGSAGRNRVRQD